MHLPWIIMGSHVRGEWLQAKKEVAGNRGGNMKIGPLFFYGERSCPQIPVSFPRCLDVTYMNNWEAGSQSRWGRGAAHFRIHCGVVPHSQNFVGCERVSLVGSATYPHDIETL